MPRTPSRSSRASPASAARFRVDWGGPAGSEGFLRVDFQPFPAEGGGELQLTRAVDGRGDLLAWLQTPPKPKVPPGRGRLRVRPPLVRTVTVALLDARGEPTVRYVFEGAQPTALALSGLDAVAGGLLTETLTLRFARVSMA